jgi:hypothetical protein
MGAVTAKNIAALSLYAHFTHVVADKNMIL